MQQNQRVVKSIKDKSGNNYTKTAAGGKDRMKAATRYMDERENTQLYTIENGRLVETDRHEAAARIEDTETKYQQHVTFTTKLDSGATLIEERKAAEHIARTVQERRPDAEIYAVAVHSDGKGDEKQVHVHVTFGTEKTLQHSDLKHFREQAYELEQQLERDNIRELSDPEREWIQQRQAERVAQRTHEQSTEHTPTAHRERGQEMER